MPVRTTLSPGVAVANQTSFKKGHKPVGTPVGQPGNSGLVTKRGRGRPKGSLDRVTKSVKEALTEAFDQMGGVKSLVRWGRANPGDFYKLWTRLLPIQVTGADGGPIKIEHKHDLTQLTTEELCHLAELVERTAIAKAMAGQQTGGVVIQLKQALAERIKPTSDDTTIEGETINA